MGKNYMYVCVRPALLSLSTCHVYYLVINYTFWSPVHAHVWTESHSLATLYTQ